VIWAELRTAAPEIARLGEERLGRMRVALLGTLRKDGSPRISPVEPFLTHTRLVFGAMFWSAKRQDLARDPRCVLHSAVSGPDSGEGELKLYGRAVEVADPVREEPAGAWWAGRPPREATVFCLDIDVAVFISWDLEHGELTIRRWSPQSGYREETRAYP
jgi:Pyridoxamine 5'-phosphate oxidase